MLDCGGDVVPNIAAIRLRALIMLINAWYRLGNFVRAKVGRLDADKGLVKVEAAMVVLAALVVRPEIVKSELGDEDGVSSAVGPDSGPGGRRGRGWLLHGREEG